MWDFEHGDLAGRFDISYTVPSLCAEALRAGTADIGIIPAISYATIPNLAILADVAIAARGPVRSILLVSRMPLENVRRIATDSSSRTSVALLRVLLDRQFGGPRELFTMPPKLADMLDLADAALLIGDSALRVDRSKYLVYDLAEEWQRMTDRPFVFAFWAVRLAALSDLPQTIDLPRIFRESREHGLKPENLREIAKAWAPRVGISEQQVISYLTENVHYFLDLESLDGMELFFRCAAEGGIIPAVPELRFLGASVRTLVH